MSENSLDITREEFEWVCTERLRPKATHIHYGPTDPATNGARAARVRDGDIWWLPFADEGTGLGGVRRRLGGVWEVIDSEGLERITAVALAERIRKLHRSPVRRVREQGEWCWTCDACTWIAQNPLDLLRVKCD